MDKIVIFGGTTEGRLLAETLQNQPAQLEIFVTTAYGASLLPQNDRIHVHTGPCPADGIRAHFAAMQPAVCVDATHPFAASITAHLQEICYEMQIPYLRVKRPSNADRKAAGTSEDSETKREHMTAAKTMSEAVSFLAGTKGNILVTTGSKEIAAIAEIPNYKERCYVRVLPTAEALRKLEDIGIRGRHVIAMQGPFGESLNQSMMQEFAIRWLLTKESGAEGGLDSKCRAAALQGVQVVMIQRPVEPADTLSLQETLAELSSMLPELMITSPEPSVDSFAARESSQSGLAPEMEIVESAAECPGISAAANPGNCSWNYKNSSSENEIDTGKKKKSATTEKLLNILGLGPGDPRQCTQAARDILKTADAWIGSPRMLELAEKIVRESVPPAFLATRAGDIVKILAEHPQLEHPAILFSGDVSLYSGAKKLRERLQGMPWTVRAWPGISSVSLFLSRLGIQLEDVEIVSAHGRNLSLIPRILRRRYVLILCGTDHDASDLAGKAWEFMTDAGDTAENAQAHSQATVRSNPQVIVPPNTQVNGGAEELKNGTRENEDKHTGMIHDPAGILHRVQLTVGSLLSMPEESIETAPITVWRGKKIPPLSLMLAENPCPAESVRIGLPDDAFIRGSVPMTKREIRTAVISRLQIRPDSIVYDIGAGTGSVSVEAAGLAYRGRVFSIEHQEEAVSLIQQNRHRFACENLEVIHGHAPEALAALPAPDKVFIGGSDGNLREILDTLHVKNPRAGIVITAVTEETLRTLWELREAWVDRYAWDSTELMAIHEKTAGRYHLRQAESPVTIVTLEPLQREIYPSGCSGP